MDWFWPDIYARLIGTAGGVVIAFAMSNDARTWGGLGRRLLVAMVFGLFLAEPVAYRLGMETETPRHIVSASCASAAIGWWLMHAIIRGVQFWHRKPETPPVAEPPVSLRR